MSTDTQPVLEAVVSYQISPFVTGLPIHSAK